VVIGGVTVRDAISKFPEPEDYKETSGVLNHWGIPGARIYKGHTGSWVDWPAKTIKAGVHGVCGGEAMIRFEDGSLRYLTIRESAEIQSFPSSYEFPGTRTAMMRAIGNAVAVEVAATIEKRLLSTTGMDNPSEETAA
jgi:DNA (cytosine-5)-methyltransferase 1